MTDRRRGWLLVGAQFALLALLVLAPTGTAWTVPDGVRLLGTIGRVAGVALIVFGGIRLGVAASVHPAPTTRAVLRTDDAYRHIRHPIYTGVLVVGAAIALTVQARLAGMTRLGRRDPVGRASVARRARQCCRGGTSTALPARESWQRREPRPTRRRCVRRYQVP
ncbi:MAG: hypothetical protein JJE52_08165 [Acidimicrobiia bacterium]|nr:hypothetical protein [Acidimicrobiia bacterium]